MGQERQRLPKNFFLIMQNAELLSMRTPSHEGFPGVTYFTRLKDSKKQGHAIHIFFLWIPDVKLSLARVVYRLKMGGHDISESVVRRSFHEGIKNFFKLYKPILNFWTLFDNSGSIPHPIAKEKDGKLEIYDSKLYDQILKIMEAQ